VEEVLNEINTQIEEPHSPYVKVTSVFPPEELTNYIFIGTCDFGDDGQPQFREGLLTFYSGHKVQFKGTTNFMA